MPASYSWASQQHACGVLVEGERYLELIYGCFRGRQLYLCHTYLLPGWGVRPPPPILNQKKRTSAVLCPFFLFL